jgi:hypothetical protein
MLNDPIAQQQPEDPNGYNPHPFKHILGMGLGAGTAYYGYSRGRRAIAPKDYSAYKKEYKAIKALKSTDPTAYETKMNAFKQKPNYGAFRTAGHLKTLGLLGLGITGYNAYKTVSSDINRHPVLNDMPQG